MVELIIRFGDKRELKKSRPRKFIIPLGVARLTVTLWAHRRAKSIKPKKLKLPLFKKEVVFSFWSRREITRKHSTHEFRLPLLSRQLSVALFSVRRPKAKRRQAKLIIPYSPRLVIATAAVLVGLAGTAYFGLVFVRAKTPPPAPNEQAYSPPVPLETLFRPKGLNESEPTGLRIPAIGLATGTFISLGRQDDGTMEVPAGYEEVGWYKFAPTPGEIGPAIIVGHVDSYRGPAVFYRLGELKPGDVIEVDRADGTIAKFKVDGIKQFSRDSFPTAEVYGDINYPGLRLITCGGNFSFTSLEYDRNTVVFASSIQ